MRDHFALRGSTLWRLSPEVEKGRGEIASVITSIAGHPLSCEVQSLITGLFTGHWRGDSPAWNRRADFQERTRAVRFHGLLPCPVDEQKLLHLFVFNRGLEQ